MRIGSDARDGRPRLEAASSDLWSCHSPCWSARYDSGTHQHRVQGEVCALSPMRSGRNDCSACAGNTNNRGGGQRLGPVIAHRNSTHAPDESKVARNLGTLTFHRYRENRRISTIRFQTLKYTQGNYVRHFWGTTPARRLSGTTTPHATTSTSSVRQHTSMAGTTPVTRHYTRYEALHPLRGATPVTGQCTPYEAPHPLRGAAPVTGQCTRSEGV